MAFKLGLDGKLISYTTMPTGSSHVPATGTELTNVKDVQLNISVQKADTTTRANQGWSSSASTLKEATLSFKMLYDPADTTYTTINSALLNNTQVAMDVLTHANGNGLRGTWSISSHNLDQTLTEAQWIDIEADLNKFGAWLAATGTGTT